MRIFRLCDFYREDFFYILDYSWRLGIFENLGIFIPGIEDFSNLRIFIPRTFILGDWNFKNLGIFIPGIGNFLKYWYFFPGNSVFFTMWGFLKHWNFYPGNLGFFHPGDWEFFEI